MKLRALSLAVLLMAPGLALASPSLQTCEPMEITHSGGIGMGYSLSCAAGPWKLNYKGSVPSGSSSVEVQYRLSVAHPDGTNLVQSRAVRLPDPSKLGQSLLREAVLLDNGNLALRECPGYDCTLYRPLGGDPKMAKASITVTPEMARLIEEGKRLSNQLFAQSNEISQLKSQEIALRSELANAKQALDAALATQAAVAEHAATAPRAWVVTGHKEIQGQLIAAVDLTVAPNQPSSIVKHSDPAEVAKLQKAQEAIRSLSSALSTTQDALLTMQSERDEALRNVKELSESNLMVLDRYDELEMVLKQKAVQLDEAQKDAGNLYAKLEASKLTQGLTGQAAQVAHMEVDALNLQVRGLSVELNKALEALTVNRKAQEADQAEKRAMQDEIEQLKTKLAQAQNGDNRPLTPVVSESKSSETSVPAAAKGAAGDLEVQLLSCKAAVSHLLQTRPRAGD